MNDINSASGDDSEINLFDQNSNLPNLLKEEADFEEVNFKSSSLYNFILSTFSPNILMSLLSVTFVIERNGIATTSFILIYGLLTHIIFSNTTSKLLHSQQKKNISDLFHEKYTFKKYFNIFCILYYFSLEIYLVLIFKDILYVPLNFISEKTNFLPLDTNKSTISVILFFLSNFFLSIFSKKIQISIFIFFSILSISLILLLAFKTLNLNYKSKYGSNRSLQIDNFNINLASSFCFFHFSLSSPPFFVNNVHHDSSRCSINGFLSTFLKTLFLIICGFSMYFSYGRYINSTQLFSFHKNDITANFCRFSYLIASISMSVILTNQLKLFVSELFENNFVDNFFECHKNASFLLVLTVPIFVSVFVKTSLPFIVICGAISFWIFSVFFISLFSLFLKGNDWRNVQNYFQLFLIAFALLMFIVAVFCAIRDMIVYYFY